MTVTVHSWTRPPGICISSSRSSMLPCSSKQWIIGAIWRRKKRSRTHLLNAVLALGRVMHSECAWHHRLLWVLSRRACVFLFYWLIIHLFPRASAAASGGVWGSAPRRLVKLVCDVLKNVSSSGCRHSWFPTAQSAIRGRCQLFVGFNSFSQFDHSCQEEERAAQSNYRSVFSPQPVARACAVPKFSC